jgi:demethylmenaquinone methyltransferase / 2-methoxy-6-polyprenyl-1,4-benzoquinol methylase
MPRPADALPDPRSGPDKDAVLVQRMFDRVAPRYDLANALFSFGRDQRWRRAAVAAVRPRPGEVALDVAAGTGMLSRALRDAGATAVALDFSFPMLAHGASRAGAGEVLWCNADGMALPLPDASVDIVTIAFGLRNLPDPAAGLAEFARVAKPGARLAVLEFSTPTAPWFRHVYHRYLVGAIPRLATLFTSAPAAYRYLAESIVAWPDQAGLAGVIGDAGWAGVQWRNLTGGIVALHRARRP